MPFALHAAAGLGIGLRPVADADLPFLSTLYGTTRADELALTGWPEATKALFVVQQFSAQHGDYLRQFPAMMRLVIERGGEAIGRLYVELTGTSCHVIDISLMPVARGQGIGAALMRDLTTYAAARSRKVTLLVRGSNPAARLYRRLGFRMGRKTGDYNEMIWVPLARR